MKDLTSSSHKHSRSTYLYAKKRSSPHGITKAHKQSPLYPSATNGRRATPASRVEMAYKRQRQLQVLALHRDGVFLEEEYRDEVQHYMHEMERFTMSSQSSMDQQPEIKWHMRPCLVDFLVDIHFTFRLRPETLYLALNILDRYVSRRIVYVKHYQLVGCACLWIAAKFEDAKDRVPTVQELACMCSDAYEESAFIQMESHVLTTIQWTLGHPTAEAWLRLMCCGFILEDEKVQHVARFLMEITLFYREFVSFTPSAIALGSLVLARDLCGKPRRLFEETEECLEIVELLDLRLAKHVNDLSEVLVKKYSYAFYSKAATFVLHHYLSGSRFVRQPPPVLASLPKTPVRSRSNAFGTPHSATSSISDPSDDSMPVTPSSPCAVPSSPYPTDPFTGPYAPESGFDKENMRSTAFSPTARKHHQEIPDHFLPHDFVTFGRPALQSLNITSPRVAAVS